MHTLRLTQHTTGENQYKVEITLEGGQSRQSAMSEFEFILSPRDQESIRWYLEDYPHYRYENPALIHIYRPKAAKYCPNSFRTAITSSCQPRMLLLDLKLRGQLVFS